MCWQTRPEATGGSFWNLLEFSRISVAKQISCTRALRFSDIPVLTLGLPVVPLVYTRVARLSGCILANVESKSAPARWSPPQEVTSSKDRTGQSSASAAAAEGWPHSTTTKRSFCTR